MGGLGRAAPIGYTHGNRGSHDSIEAIDVLGNGDCRIPVVQSHAVWPDGEEASGERGAVGKAGGGGRLPTLYQINTRARFRRLGDRLGRPAPARLTAPPALPILPSIGQTS